MTVNKVRTTDIIDHDRAPINQNLAMPLIINILSSVDNIHIKIKITLLYFVLPTTCGDFDSALTLLVEWQEGHPVWKKILHHLWQTFFTVVKVVMWSGGGLTWRSQVRANPIPIPHPTNLALFGHKITLYRFNQGAHTIAGAQIGAGAEPPAPLL